MKATVNGQEVTLEPQSEGVTIAKMADRLIVHSQGISATALAVRIGHHTHVSFRGNVYEVSRPGSSRKSGAAASQGEAHAPMPGLIVDVLVAKGDKVNSGDKLLVLEAMKTQQPILAPFDGVVESLPVEKGQQVVEGMLLVKVAPEAD